MATFTIEFERGVPPKPTYGGGYSQTIYTNCGDDAQPRSIKFNDITGSFVVGFNYENSANGGLPADRIRIYSYQDYTVEADLVSGNQTVLTQYAGTLMDSSTGLDLTYTYEIPLTELPNIIQHHNSPELVCIQSDLSKYRYTRVRTISYAISDTAGHWGDSASATFININTT